MVALLVDIPPAPPLGPRPGPAGPALRPVGGRLALRPVGGRPPPATAAWPPATWRSERPARPSP
ncbi:MAG: hypothetical protein ACRDWW_03420, partial [Acidimicrobiales bacterium]